MSQITVEQQLRDSRREAIESFNNKVDTSVSKLYDAYDTILTHSQVSTVDSYSPSYDLLLTLCTLF